MEELAEAVNTLVQMVESFRGDIKCLQQELATEKYRVEDLKRQLQEARAPKE